MGRSPHLGMGEAHLVWAKPIACGSLRMEERSDDMSLVPATNVLASPIWTCLDSKLASVLPPTSDPIQE